MEEKEKAITFEERLQAVQELIDSIESGNLPLEQSVEQYETGMRLLDELDRDLESINRRLTVLQDGAEKESGQNADI